MLGCLALEPLWNEKHGSVSISLTCISPAAFNLCGFDPPTHRHHPSFLDKIRGKEKTRHLEKWTPSEVGCKLSRSGNAQSQAFSSVYLLELFGAFKAPLTWNLRTRVDTALYPLSSFLSLRNPATLASPSTTSFLLHFKITPLPRSIDLLHLTHLTHSPHRLPPFIASHGKQTVTLLTTEESRWVSKQTHLAGWVPQLLVSQPLDFLEWATSSPIADEVGGLISKLSKQSH